MLDNSGYTPIKCSFYDMLESYATLQKRIKIEIKIDVSGSKIIEEKIVDFELRNGEELAVLSSGIRIRLDYILSVDGWSVENLFLCT